MYALIACGVFEEEIERIAKDLNFTLEARYLEPGLHVDFDLLAGAIRAELEDCRGYDGIIVAYGACHPKMEEILKPYPAVLLDAQNCVDAFITRGEVERWAEKGLYFYLSPGWVKCWQEIFESLGWGQEEARMELGSFKGAVFLDTLDNAVDYGEELLEFFDFTLLLPKVVPVDLSHFKKLITDAKNRLEV